MFWIVPAVRQCDHCAGSVGEGTAYYDGLCESFDCTKDHKGTIIIRPEDIEQYHAERVVRALEGNSK